MKASKPFNLLILILVLSNGIALAQPGTNSTPSIILYGYELPFLEDWSSGSFETLQWTIDSDHWVINSSEGNPAPSVSFQGEPGLTDYEAILESYPINAVGMTVGKIWLDFDLKLLSNISTGEESLRVQVWNSSDQIWTTVADYFNDDGTFGWEWQHINIESVAMNKVVKIRFVATGVNSQDIAAWYIDNIHVFRKCVGPSDLELEENWEYNELNWELPEIGFLEDWLEWDDGINGGNAIGTGSPVEFDAAARWLPEHLAPYFNMTVYKIAFFPAEPEATYNVRIWSGEGPDTLVLDQLVVNPVMNSWNTVDLETPLEIDVTKELWVGYHVSTPTGYPAGADDGPAIDGFGNMMYFDNVWQTLLQLNPALNFNWNIAFNFISTSYDEDLTYYIYRDVNQQGFEYLGQSVTDEYVDSNIDLADYYCYYVTLNWAGVSDTCESEPTNTACEVLMLGTGQEENESSIRIYPNPAKDFLNIESPEKISEVRIYNMLGECEMKLEIGNWEGRVDVSRSVNGIYCVEVVTEKMIFKDKILIFR